MQYHKAKKLDFGKEMIYDQEFCSPNVDLPVIGTIFMAKLDFRVDRKRRFLIRYNGSAIIRAETSDREQTT